jgi:uncharacterized protein (DUF433 family)
MPVTKQYVVPDAAGVLRVAGGPISLDSVIAGFHRGDSPETIQQAFPDLCLEQVYGAIAYYLANCADVDEYLRRQRTIWDAARAKSEVRSSPMVERLRSQRAVETAEKP